MKKIWMILPAILLAFGLVFTSCGGDSKGGGDEEMELFWSLDEWFDEGGSTIGDAGETDVPFVQAGSPTIEVDTTARIINVTSRVNDYDGVQLLIRGANSLDLARVKLEVKVEGTVTGTVVAGTKIKLAMPGDPYSTFASTDIAAGAASELPFSFTATVPSNYAQNGVQIQSETSASGNNTNLASFSITNIEVYVPATPPAFVAVTNITGVATEGLTGEGITLSGTVAPVEATNQDIVWEVSENDDGSTGATIEGNVLTATDAGTATVTARVVNGATESTDYTKDFEIEIVKLRDVTPTGAFKVVVASGDLAVGSGSTATVQVANNLGAGDENGFTFSYGSADGYNAYATFKIEFPADVYLADYASVSFTYTATGSDVNYKPLIFALSADEITGYKSQDALLALDYGVSTSTGAVTTATPKTITIAINRLAAIELDGESDLYAVLYIHGPANTVISFSNIVFTPINDDGSTVDTTFLSAAIDTAEAALVGIVPSTDGTDVLSSVKWATSADIEDLEDAIAAAKTVVSTATNQSEVEAAITDLNAAVSTFNGKTSAGTLDASALDPAIAAAEAALEGVEASTDGTDVSTSVEWATSANIATFEAAIAAAKAVQATPVNQATVDAAVTAIGTATTTFEGQKSFGSLDTSDLSDAIDAAKAALEGIVSSADGKDLLDTVEWVETSAYSTFVAAIAAAEAVIITPVDSATVSAAETAITTATSTFTALIANGWLASTPFEFDLSGIDTKNATAWTSAYQALKIDLSSLYSVDFDLTKYTKYTVTAKFYDADGDDLTVDYGRAQLVFVGDVDGGYGSGDANLLGTQYNLGVQTIDATIPAAVLEAFEEDGTLPSFIVQNSAATVGFIEITGISFQN